MKKCVIGYTIVGWVIGMFLVMLLSGCARHTEYMSSINDSLQQDVAQLIDYANNNMADDPDTTLLKTGLKDCAARADAIAKQCEVTIDTYKANANRLKSERNTLIVFFLLLLGIRLFNIRL